MKLEAYFDIRRRFVRVQVNLELSGKFISLSTLFAQVFLQKYEYKIVETENCL